METHPDFVMVCCCSGQICQQHIGGPENVVPIRDQGRIAGRLVRVQVQVVEVLGIRQV